MKKRFWALLLFTVLLCGCGKAPANEEQLATHPVNTQATTQETTMETTVETTVALPETLEFGYAGEYLTCLNAQSMLGIDVSSFQKEIDWEKVASAGVEFAMIRVGFRGYGEKGTLIEDKYAQANYQGAKAAGLKVGGYFFSQATNREEAVEEAEYVLELTKDWETDLPFGFDWECHTQEYRTKDVDAQTLTDCTNAFREEMANRGKDVLIYVNLKDSPKQMYWEQIRDCRVWLGQYAENLDTDLPVAMWQYTNEGQVAGISGNVDINLFLQEAA